MVEIRDELFSPLRLVKMEDSIAEPNSSPAKSRSRRLRKLNLAVPLRRSKRNQVQSQGTRSHNKQVGEVSHSTEQDWE